MTLIDAAQAVGHRPVDVRALGADAIAFLTGPRLPWPTRFAYHRLLHAAVATIPPRLQESIGVRTHRGARTGGRAVTGVLRTAMGSSPAWAAALDRCGEPRPSGVRFRNTPGTTQ